MSDSNELSCPNCARVYVIDDPKLAGKRVRCQSCQQTFVVSVARQPSVKPSHPGVERTVPQTPPADDADSWRTDRFESEQTRKLDVNSEATFSAEPDLAAPSFARTGSRPLIIETGESDTQDPIKFWAGLFQLLDLRLERYMTPYIVRVYWVMALVAVLLYGIDFAFGSVTGQNSRSSSDEAAFAELLGQRNPRVPQPSKSSSAYDAFRTFKGVAIWLIGVTSIILGVRVFCEILVVAFNMANSLKSIDRQIANLGRRNE